MPTVDELLGPPSVDDLLGPQQTPTADALLGVSPPADDGRVSLADRFFENTAAGRVLAAFGQGAKDGFGADRLGLSPETEAEMRRMGIFQGVEKSVFDSVKGFNEALLRPAAVAMEAAGRAAVGGIRGLAQATGQFAEEAGIDPDTQRVEHEIENLANYLLMRFGVAPMRLRPPKRSMTGEARAGTRVDPAAPEGSPMRPFEPTPPPERPAQLFDRSETPAVDKAGNINLERIVAPEDVKNVIREAAAQGERVQGAMLREPPIVEFRRIAVAVESGLPPVQEGFARVWRGNRPGEVGTATTFTNDLAGIALPFRKMYGGDLSYVDVSASRLTTFENKAGTAAGAEFNLPVEIAKNAVAVKLPERAAPPDFAAARRGTMSLEQIEELADAIGMTRDQLLKRKVGEAFNAEEAVAARKLLVQSATEVRNAAVKAAGGTDADVMAFQQAMTRHMAIQEQVAGMTAEAGRALSSFRIAAGEEGGVARAIEAMGGRAPIEEMARMVAGLETPQQLSKFAMEARKATKGEMFIEAWMNALLSGPRTHVTNVLSNTLVSALAVPETALAAGIGKLRDTVSPPKRGANFASERVLLGEAGARLFGMVQGSKEGIRAAWKAFDTETPSDMASKLEVPKPRAIPSKTVRIGGAEFEIGGRQLRIPGRMLMAEDEFFKAIGRRQELNALAYRQAAGEGLTGDALAARIAALIDNPTPAMVEKARTTAEYQTFTTALGPTGQAIQRFSNSHPLAKLVVPFIRTPVNIVKFAAERTPFGLAMREARDNLAGKNGRVAQDTQLARMTLGAMVGTAAVSLAAEGLITGGGPKEPARKAVMYLNGWQPYSVKIGDFYYSYARMEPLGMLLGVSADMYEIGTKMTDPETESVAGLVMASITKNLVSKTWLQGPADLIQAVEDPERYGDRYLNRLVGSVVPTAMAQYAQSQDPFLKDARNVLDAIKARTPGLAQDVLPRRDIWGEPIAMEGSLGPDLLSPIYERRVNNDPVNRELLAVKMWPAKLERKIRDVKLTDQQYDEYQQTAGRLAKYMLDQIVAIPGWTEMPVAARQDTYRRVIGKARESARVNMILKHPDLYQKVQAEAMKKLGPAQSVDDVLGK